MRHKIAKGVTTSGEVRYIRVKKFFPTDLNGFYKALQVEEARLFIVKENILKSEEDFEDFIITKEITFPLFEKMYFGDIMELVINEKLVFNYFYF